MQCIKFEESQSSFSHSCKACCHQYHLSLCEISKYFHGAFLFNLSDSKKKEFPCDKFILKFTRWSIKVNNQFLFGLKLYFTYKLQSKGKDAIFTFILWVCDSWTFHSSKPFSRDPLYDYYDYYMFIPLLCCIFLYIISVFCLWEKQPNKIFPAYCFIFYRSNKHVLFIFTKYMRRKDNSWVLEIT